MQETADGNVEIAAVDPIVSMKAICNYVLHEMAETIGQKLQQVVQNA